MTTLQRIFIEITSTCNLRCRLCKLWQNTESTRVLTLGEKLAFIKDVLNYLEKSSNKNNNTSHGPLPSVILTGGEPFLYPEQVFSISDSCRLKGVNCYVNINGSKVRLLIDQILNSGLTAITFSIDSHDSQTHDRLRGLNGLHDEVTNTIREMLKRKRKIDSSTLICVQSILGNWNLNSLPEHLSFLRNLGIDKMAFQPIQYPFGLQIPANWHENFPDFPNSKSEIKKAIAYLVKIKKNDDFITNSIEEINLWKSYFDNPELLPNGHNPCKAFEQNIIIDVYGNVRFCFNEIPDPIDKIGNIRTASIKSILESKAALETRKKMMACNRSCGIMACHIDANLQDG